LRTPQPDQIEPGQIWSTRSLLELSDGRRFEADEPRLIVILDGTGDTSEFLDQIAVAPVSLSTQMAAGSDLIISGDDNPLGFDFMVEVWNETPVLKGHLKRFLGRLPDEAVAAVRSLYTAQLLDEDIPSPVAEQVGLCIMGDNDPRLAFQEAEVEMVAYLAKAATAVLTLEVAVQEPVSMPATSLKPRWVFSLHPRLTRLSEVISRPAMAHAAGVADEVETYIVHQPEGDARFMFELRFRQRRPYTIYLKVHKISPELEGHRSVVTVNTSTGEWRSMPAELQAGARIQVGEDPNFRLSEVQVIEVEIE
jgi:hypothetical protein